MVSISKIVMKLLGILLIAGAILKGWQLLTEPMANKNIWTNRAFLVFVVEFELALGIWLLSGLFKKAAWLTTLGCFSLFSFITLYKGFSGAESCGCFGTVHVNPWITLFAIDIPSLVALTVFRPKGEKLLAWPSNSRFGTVLGVGLLTLGTVGCVLVFNKPAKITPAYEVLEPRTWIGRKLPILEHIDIAESLQDGTWVILLYHHDCPNCITAILKYKQTMRDLKGNRDHLRIGLIEVPPYGPKVKDQNRFCSYGYLKNTKDWFITTPTVVLSRDGKVNSVWETEVPDLDTIIESVTNTVNGDS